MHYLLYEYSIANVFSLHDDMIVHYNIFRFSLEDVVAIIEDMDDDDGVEGICIDPPNGNVSNKDTWRSY